MIIHLLAKLKEEARYVMVMKIGCLKAMNLLLLLLQQERPETDLDFKLVVLVLALPPQDVARDADLHRIPQAVRTRT